MGSTGATRIGAGGNMRPAEERTALKGSRADIEAEVDKLTPEQFVGRSFTRLWDGTGLDLAEAVDNIAPSQLVLAGRTFNALGEAMYMPMDSSGWLMVTKEYQSTDTMGGEYPLFRVTIMARRTPSGRITTQIKKTGVFKSGLM